MKKYRWKLKIKGGPGSGHHGHAGRPGKRGGSLPGRGTNSAVRFSDLDRDERKDVIRNLRPDTRLQLFHGVRKPEQALRILDEGFDPSASAHGGAERVYAGRLAAQEGYYVSPFKEVSTSFGSFVIEFEAPAKKLTAPPQKDVPEGGAQADEFWRSVYPNSFSPGLSSSLSMGESQGLLVDKVGPGDVKAVWVWNGKRGEWTPLPPGEFKENVNAGMYKSAHE